MSLKTHVDLAVRSVRALHMLHGRVTNKRIQKKRSIRRPAVECVRESSRFGVESVHLSFACPLCRRFTLSRTYVPQLGNMNGVVECSRCRYRDQFANALAVDMSSVDPVPPAFTARRPEPVAALAPAIDPRPNVWRGLLAQTLVWWRALARSLRAPAPQPRRLVRAHSTTGGW